MPAQFDRKYKITVQTWTGNTIVFDADLRVTFQVEKSLLQILQYAEVTAYNLNPQTESDIYKNAKTVEIEAGYQEGQYGRVFRGNVRQCLRSKEDGVTYFVKMVCIDGDDVLNTGIASFTQTFGASYEQLVNQIARSSTVPFAVRIEGQLPQQEIQRGKPVFGKALDKLRDVAVQTNQYLYMDDGDVVLSPAITSPPASVPELNATNGMIGFPMQVDKGVNVKILINPGVKLGSWIRLNNQTILQQQIDFLNPGFYTLLDADGLYRVVELRITGDTRGNDWYYDIIAYSQSGGLPATLANQYQSGF